MVTVSEQQIKEVLLAVLDEGNPFSTIEWEFSSGFDDVSQINREDFCSEVASRLKSLSKLTDHCTEEERAVVEAAVQWFKDETVFQRSTIGPLADTVQQLLATRKESP